MASINVSYLLGYVGKEPETRATQSGKMVTVFNMATEQSWKKGEEWQRQTTWHRIIGWELSDYVLKGISKGSQVMVQGRISNREYKDEKGETRMVSEIVAEKVIPLNPAPPKQVAAPDPPPKPKPPYTPPPDDDIPF